MYYTGGDEVFKYIIIIIVLIVIFIGLYIVNKYQVIKDLETNITVCQNKIMEEQEPDVINIILVKLKMFIFIIWVRNQKDGFLNLITKEKSPNV